MENISDVECENWQLTILHLCGNKIDIWEGHLYNEHGLGATV